MGNVQDQLQCFDMSQSYYPNLRHNSVLLDNEYRKSRPYRLFRDPGVSSTTMTFGLSGAKKITKIILELNHCSTTGNGVTDIVVNGSVVLDKIKAPRDNFGKERFELPVDRFKPDGNEVQIRLGSQSPGVYWLSDATVYVERLMDQSEEEIKRLGRAILVNTRKLLTQRAKLISELRNIASALDELHLAIEKYKVGGGIAKLGGYLLMLGGAALQVISAGTATPVVAAMEAGGFALVVGGSATEVGSEIWEAIENTSQVAESDRMLAEDKKCRDEIAANENKLRNLVQQNADQYRRDHPALISASIEKIMIYMLKKMLFSLSDDAINAGKFSGLEIFTSVFRVVSTQTLKKALFGIDAIFTIYDVMDGISQISHGEPSEIGQNLRSTADELERDLQTVDGFMQDTLTNLLTEIRGELESCNLRTVSQLLQQLTIFDEIKARQGSLNMSWLNNWVPFEETLSPEQLANLANALNQIYQSLQETIRKMQSSGHVDLVIVAHGSVGIPTDAQFVNIPALSSESLVPSNVLFATQNLTSVTFYQPWGMYINAVANYAVVKGTIHPSQTSFMNASTMVSVPNPLARFNVLEASSGVLIPSVWCNAIDDNDPALALLQMFIANGPPIARPYIWWRMGSVPSFFLTSLAAITALLFSTSTSRIELRIHHGQCLNWPSREAPPAALLGLQQYYNAIGESFNDTITLTL